MYEATRREASPRKSTLREERRGNRGRQRRVLEAQRRRGGRHRPLAADKPVRVGDGSRVLAVRAHGERELDLHLATTQTSSQPVQGVGHVEREGQLRHRRRLERKTRPNRVVERHEGRRRVGRRRGEADHLQRGLRRLLLQTESGGDARAGLRSTPQSQTPRSPFKHPRVALLLPANQFVLLPANQLDVKRDVLDLLLHAAETQRERVDLAAREGGGQRGQRDGQLRERGDHEDYA